MAKEPTIFQDPKQYSGVERITGVPAGAMIQRSGLFTSPNPQPNVTLPSSRRIRVMDNACGTGIVTSLLLDAVMAGKMGDEIRLDVVCGDLEESMVQSVNAKAKDSGWEAFADVRAERIDSQAINQPDNTFDYVFTNFGFQAMPKPNVALSETVRVTKPGGTIAFTTWKRVGWIPSFNRALARLSPLFPADAQPPRLLDTLVVMPDSRWDEQSFIESALSSVPIDASSIVVTELTFDQSLLREEDKAMIVGMTSKVSKVHLPAHGWTEDQIKVIEGEKLMMALKEEYQSLESIPWKAWVVVAKKE